MASQSSDLNNAFFYYLPAGLFPTPPFRGRAFFSIFLVVFVGLFFKCTCGHIVVEHLPQAQHSAISPAQSSEASTCRSERDKTSKLTELAGESTWSSIYSSLWSQNEPRDRNLPGLWKEVHNYSQISWFDARSFFFFRSLFSISQRSNTAIYLRPFSFVQHAASGLFSWSMKLLAFRKSPFSI